MAKGQNFGIKDKIIYYDLNGSLEREIKEGDILQEKDNLSYMYQVYGLDAEKGIIRTNKILKDNCYMNIKENMIIKKYVNGYVITKYTHDIFVNNANGTYFKYLLR